MTFAERGMGGNTLWTWHIKFRATRGTENVYINLDTLFPTTRRIIINKTFTNNYRGRFVNGRYVRRFMNKFNKRVMSRFYRTKDWYHQKQVYRDTEIVILKNSRCLMRRLPSISTFYLDDDFL